ncbi:MAG: selenocysteine-specific translation elongation factor [candidate division KSB1 bacterium]|nr:selenocysteine-specific translation elongation factor [candidate division KSB1 bacterium]
MRHIIIGTAGHIDHGKSSLVKALTGTDPDRLKEEKEREMTIDLGFAFLGDNITFIDVPGHEKFVKNMAAGVSTIDMVLLVIAADDGIMPQTQEHFEILQLLGVNKGLIVVTKIDMVEPDWLELVIEEIKELVKGTFLEGAPIIPVSNVTGQGIAELKNLILSLAQQFDARPDKGVFRLWVDRVFTMKGSGTVIAGTVLSGSCKTGDTVELLPQQRQLRVRRVQVHNKTLEQCVTGERAAINLMDIEKEEIERGNMLAKPGYYQPTYMLNARLNLLKSSPHPLKNRDRIRLHLGTGEIIARAVLLEKQELFPGESTFVQFRLEAPYMADYGDRYVIRSFSPAQTIGGGTIVEVHPPKLKYLPEQELQRLALLEKADPHVIVEQYLLKNEYALKTVSSLAQELSLAPEAISQVLETLRQRDRVTVINEKPEWAVIHAAHFQGARSAILDFLKKFHQEHPMLWGIKKSELRERLFGKMSSVLFDAILETLLRENSVTSKDEKIFLTGHEIRFTPKQQEIKNQVEQIYLKTEYVTPGWDEIVTEVAGKPKDILDVVTGLIELGVLVEIKYYEKPAIFHKTHIDKAQEILVNYLKQHGEIRLGEFREMINSTRKFATPILVYFDQIGITEREGEIRRLAR